MASIFTKISNKEIPAYIIKEDEQFIAFLDIFPVKKGHTLVVPKIEVDKIFDVPDSYLQQILLFAKPIAHAIQKVVNCNRVNILTVGLEVPHAHIHLLPTNTTNDVDITALKLQFSKEEFLQIQNDIKSYLY
jgi:histidine triad (HIT) family protein